MSRRKFRFVLIMIVLMGCVVWFVEHRAPICITLLLLNVAAFVFASQPPRPAFSEAVTRNAWRRFYWLWAPVLYWFVVLNNLGIAAPIYEDGYGPEPSFWWGRPLIPDGSEYYRHHAYYNLRFFLPYCIAAVTMTYLGCIIAPRIVRRFRRLTVSAPAATASVAALLILLVAGFSDVGTRNGLWQGPTFFSWDYQSWQRSLIVLSLEILPAAILSGVLALGRRSYEICERNSTKSTAIQHVL